MTKVNPAATIAAVAEAEIAARASPPRVPGGAAWTKPESGVTPEVITFVTSIQPLIARVE